MKYGPNFLKGVREFRVPPEVTSDVVKKYLEALDCPRSLTVWLLFSSNEHNQIADLEFDPSLYSSFESCRDAYAATKFLSKFKDLSTNRD
jgi:hypothetical protein